MHTRDKGKAPNVSPQPSAAQCVTPFLTLQLQGRRVNPAQSWASAAQPRHWARAALARAQRLRLGGACAGGQELETGKLPGLLWPEQPLKRLAELKLNVDTSLSSAAGLGPRMPGEHGRAGPSGAAGG